MKRVVGEIKVLQVDALGEARRYGAGEAVVAEHEHVQLREVGELGGDGACEPAVREVDEALPRDSGISPESSVSKCVVL